MRICVVEILNLFHVVKYKEYEIILYDVTYFF